jgi:hypothetical protein
VSGKFAAGGRGGGRFTYAMKVPEVVALVRELHGQRYSLRQIKDTCRARSLHGWRPAVYCECGAELRGG